MRHSTHCMAPASIGNFIVGFDTLGLAIQPIDGTSLYDVVEVSASQKTTLQISGTYAGWVPAGEDNLVQQAAQKVNTWLSNHQYEKQQWLLHLNKGLPVGSGTGSSAASCVAAIGALSEWLEKNQNISIPIEQRWQLMAELEGSVSGTAHLDNIAPAVLGGLVLCPTKGLPQRLPFFDDWYLVLVYSGQILRTSEARARLPKLYPAKHSIEQIQRISSVIDGLYRQNRQQVLDHLGDHFAEPYRAELINGYSEIKPKLLEHGALAAGISGAGPSFFCICKNIDDAKNVQQFINTNLNFTEGGFIKICRTWHPHKFQ